MRKFKRRGDVISSELSAEEVQLLESLMRQLIEMINADAEERGAKATSSPSTPPSDDPFAVWADELSDDEPVEPPEDPVVRRLLPDAYPHDPKASAEFRRFTDRDLRQKKITDAEVCLRHLSETQGGQEKLRIPVDEADHWLRALTSVRLAVAGRLGITDNEAAEELAELPDDDPRAFMASIYDWLGFAQETLVSAL
jgi:hypothetical protein